MLLQCKEDIDTGKEPKACEMEEKLDVPQIDVPAFQAVINSARVAEEEKLEKVAVGNVEELLSAVAGPPVEVREASLTSAKQPLDACKGLRMQACAIPPITQSVLYKLEDADEAVGYDCAPVLARPLSFCQVVRLQATVLQPSTNELLAPLALQMSVLYQVTVSRQLHASMPSVPMAFSSMSTSFQVSPCDRPALRIAVDGATVMLFDTVVGRFTLKSTFADAPGHLQDYVLHHRSAVPGGSLQTSSALRLDTTQLEFQECALLVGSHITLVGELSRDPGGDLVLKPSYLSVPELNGSPRVLVSDDPDLNA